MEDFIEEVKRYVHIWQLSRPTAVNLFWALERMETVVTENAHLSIGQLKDRLLEEAKEIHEKMKKLTVKSENMH